VAAPNSRRGRAIAELIAAHRPDIICLTERSQASPDNRSHRRVRRQLRLSLSSWAAQGHSVEPEPWHRVDAAARTLAKWSVRLRRYWNTVGLGSGWLCIPWRDAHVRTGRRDRRPGKTIGVLHGLSECLNQHREVPVLLAGDFNQRSHGHVRHLALPTRLQKLEAAARRHGRPGPGWAAKSSIMWRSHGLSSRTRYEESLLERRGSSFRSRRNRGQVLSWTRCGLTSACSWPPRPSPRARSDPALVLALSGQRGFATSRRRVRWVHGGVS